MHHETALLYQFSLQLIAIIVKCLRRTPLFACRMASGLMEILKARNSINLLLIDLISFLRPPIDTPKKKLSCRLLDGCREEAMRPTINSYEYIFCWYEKRCALLLFLLSRKRVTEILKDIAMEFLDWVHRDVNDDFLFVR